MRVVVAGTAFGRIYLDAMGGEFALAGVLSRGGGYSRDLAARLGVPLFTGPEQVPDDVDVACVVVRSGATGGPGTDLAAAFLERGVHVLQEHPVHAAEITACAQAARRGGAAYAVNTLYPNIRPVRRFLAAAAHLRARGPIRYLDAACNSQVAYPLLDILGRAAGGLRPWSFGPADPGDPFHTLRGEIGGVPVTLRVQNQVHPDDPDNHSYLMHRVELGCDAGVLTLADTHGPVLWNPRLHSPRDETGRLVMAGPGTERLDVPSTVVIGGDEIGTYHDVFADLWPDAVRVALRELADDIAEPARRAKAAQWALSVSRAWSDLTARIGMPALIRPDEPPALPVDEIAAAAGHERTRA